VTGFLENLVSKPALEVGVLKKMKFGEVKQRRRPMLCTKVDIYISQKLTQTSSSINPFI
jgi:hypothetical protein